MERFSCETVVVSGEGALEALAEQPGKRLLVVRDSMELTAGILEKIRGILKPEAEAVFAGATVEPTMAQAVAGVRLVKSFSPELVVAVGGSHVLDCAKAMVCFSGKKCPLAVVPTEAGSGTEVTSRVTLTHEGRRHGFRDPGLRPELAILDSSLLGEVPAGKIAQGGFSILAGSLQAYLGKDGGMLTGLPAREAFSVCWGALSAAYAGNPAARGRLQGAAVLAGLAADQRGLGLCRALGDALGSRFHLAPGVLDAIVLPPVIGCNAHAAGRKMAELSRAAGLGGSSEGVGVSRLKAGLVRLRRELGLPGTLAQAGVNPRWVWGSAREIVALTLEHPESRNNPVAADDFLIRRILEEVTGQY